MQGSVLLHFNSLITSSLTQTSLTLTTIYLTQHICLKYVLAVSTKSEEADDLALISGSETEEY